MEREPASQNLYLNWRNWKCGGGSSDFCLDGWYYELQRSIARPSPVIFVTDHVIKDNDRLTAFDPGQPG